MKITYDKEADAAYIYFSGAYAGEVTKTVELNDSVNLDFDKKGVLLGIEVLDAKIRLPSSTLAAATLI